jgi:hypothetical protein
MGKKEERDRAHTNQINLASLVAMLEQLLCHKKCFPQISKTIQSLAGNQCTKLQNLLQKRHQQLQLLDQN